MQVVMEGKNIAVKDMTLDQWRLFMGEFMKRNPNASAAWDIMGCVRGPDSPSERPNMSPSEHSEAYAGRRKRKKETVEVIREAMFFGVVGGCARHHVADHVILPPQTKWEHFDRHVAAAAGRLGLRVEIKGK